MAPENYAVTTWSFSCGCTWEIERKEILNWLKLIMKQILWICIADASKVEKQQKYGDEWEQSWNLVLLVIELIKFFI